jgi:chemotaxis protein methyltransferase CheR
MTNNTLHRIENVFLSNEDLSSAIDLIKSLHDVDFSGYGKESLRRRFNRLMIINNWSTYYELKFSITNGKLPVTDILSEITVNMTSMFRDVNFYKAAKTSLFPYLETFPSFKIWHAGCSTGEEMYSFSILMEEAGLLKKSTQYGTDLNQEALKVAKKGVYQLKEMASYAKNYMECGGVKPFSDYYVAKYNAVKMLSLLSKRMVFSQHNLVNNSSFNEFECVVCRNVLIYFNKELKNRVLKLFYDSICPRGFLLLGGAESIKGTVVENLFEVIDGNNKIYRKKISYE